ncbi:hypothetical protein [Rhodospirillaceae bacterium SYSU D60014]|uniref:hypothetical protein n=1 Tax=Virgifigura deserti TaxID=2268457 RepID=UPI0013C44FE0
MLLYTATFRDWFNRHLSSHACGIVNDGMDSYASLIPNHSRLFNRFAPEIWSTAAKDAERAGYDNVFEYIARWRCADKVAEWPDVETLMVWYACERAAREVAGE